MSAAPWAAHFGLARTPFGKAIPRPGPCCTTARRTPRPIARISLLRAAMLVTSDIRTC